MITKSEIHAADEAADEYLEARRQFNQAMERRALVPTPPTQEERLEHAIRVALERIDLYDVEGARHLLAMALKSS